MYPNNNQPAPQRPPRRVGSLTMALSLIAVGAIMLAKLFVPSISLLTLLRFTPAVLVLLGFEILLANLFTKNAPLKYDFLSVFLSIILITGSLTTAIGVEALQNGLNASAAAEGYMQELSQKANEAVKGLDYIATVDVISPENSYFRYYLQQNETLDDFVSANHVELMVYFSKPFDDKQAFADACAETTGRLLNAAPTVSTIWFSYLPLNYPSPQNTDLYLGDTLYSLVLRSYGELHLNAADMLPLITEWEWDEATGRYYVLGTTPPPESDASQSTPPDDDSDSGSDSGSDSDSGSASSSGPPSSSSTSPGSSSR